MSEVQSLTVVLETGMTREGAKMLADAITCMRGVAAVSVPEDTTPNYVARTQLRIDTQKKLVLAIDAILSDGKDIPEDWKKW